MQTKLDRNANEWMDYERVIVFDGVCNWCNFWVNFTMDCDPSGKFKFGTLQSEPAQRIMSKLGLSLDKYETFLLLDHGRVFTKSTAVLNVTRHLSGIWPLFFYLGIVIPRPIRDHLYDIVAKNRYALMGKSVVCRIPTPAERERFVGFDAHKPVDKSLPR
jgi:predicted DCC family thiol-disulfide oxidoreductase YuxK